MSDPIDPKPTRIVRKQPVQSRAVQMMQEIQRNHPHWFSTTDQETGAPLNFKTTEELAASVDGAEHFDYNEHTKTSTRSASPDFKQKRSLIGEISKPHEPVVRKDEDFIVPKVKSDG